MGEEEEKGNGEIAEKGGELGGDGVGSGGWVGGWGGRRGSGGFGFGSGLENEGFGEGGFQEMLGGGEASGSFGGVIEAGDAEDDGVGGIFETKAARGFEAGLAEGSGEAKDSSHRAYGRLAVFGKLGKTVFEFGFWTAVKANDPGH